MLNLENPIVIDSLWKDKEKKPKIVGECEGCREDIYAGEDVYEFYRLGEIVYVHQNSECCQLYIGEISFCKVAGE